jgi:hypothetical protein
MIVSKDILEFMRYVILALVLLSFLYLMVDYISDGEGMIGINTFFLVLIFILVILFARWVAQSNFKLKTSLPFTVFSYSVLFLMAGVMLSGILLVSFDRFFQFISIHVMWVLMIVGNITKVDKAN